MINDNHVQHAGDSAQQIQAQNVIVNIGITEQRAREIYNEMNALARQNYTQEAYELACKRVSMLEEHLMQKVDQVNGLLEAFGDPSFQYLLVEAQKSVAATEREADYALLSELLACRVEKGEDRKIRTGISHAVQIVDEIDDDALCALTVSFALMEYLPVTGNCLEGLGVLNNLFEKLIYRELPNGNDWTDHLDILGAIRCSTLGKMTKVLDHLPKLLNGYVCAGIQINSSEYTHATQILASKKIPTNFLVKNECLEGYVRLNISTFDSISNLSFSTATGCVSLSDSQKDAVREVWKLYSNDKELQQRASERFAELWDSYKALRLLRSWWDAIPNSFTITQVGEVLAYTNAKRLYPQIPDLL